MENNEEIKTLDNDNIKTNNNKGLIIVIVVLVILLISVSGYFIYDKFISKDEPKTTTTTNETTTNSDINAYDNDTSSPRKLNVKEIADSNSSVKINDNFAIKFVKMTDEEVKNANEMVENYNFKIIVNNQYIMNDWTFLNYYDFEVSYTDDYLFFTNIGSTDIRSKTVYVISKEGKMVHSFYELEDVKGMVPSTYKIQDNKLIIEGSRRTHGPSIVYETMYDTCEQLKTLDENLVVKATYIYSLKDNKYELENKTDSYTLKQFFNDDRKECLN